MGRVLWALLALALFLFWRRGRSRIRAVRSPTSAPVAPIVRCAGCEVWLPRADASDATGVWLCPQCLQELR